mmetsp:Transcript_11689/g.26658  ORF Transcript_11689/g.26658 Transcript_11689/m.26658 type:complete len:416 (+) Transcript_11689:64-1311(+)
MTTAVGSTKRKDPLVLLRECTSKQAKVHYSDDYLEFDGHRVHRSAKCGYRLTPTDPFIDIGSVWYMFREISGDRPYTQETTRKRGFRYIGVANRGDLCDWLVGRVDTCAGIARDVIEGRKRPRDDAEESGRKHGKKLASKPSEETSISSVPRVKAGDISYADVLARVRPVKDLDVLVRCPGRTVPNAELILKIAQDEVANWRIDRRTQDQPAPPGKVPLLKELEQMILDDRTNQPIILVPCNKNSPVNLLNASKLLQDGEYHPKDEERLRFFESTRPEYVEIVRNVMGKMWTFEVRDSVKGFTKAQWLRVVAVVTDGTDWQFKGWPFETIVDLFTTVKGIYFTEVGTLPPQHVTEWNVSILSLTPLQFQHRFSAIRDTFWTEVENFLREYRQKRFVNHTTLQPDKRIVVKPKPIL